MRTIFIIWTERLNVLAGGVHRIIDILLTHLPSRGFDVNYLYTTDNYNTFHHYGAPFEDNVIKVYDLKQYLFDNNCDIIIGQDGVFSSSLALIVRDLKLDNFKFVTEYHNSPQLLIKTFTRQRMLFEFQQARGSRRLPWLMKFCFYPIWLKRCRKYLKELYSTNYEIADRIILLSSNELPGLMDIMSRQELAKCVCINNPLTLKKISDVSILEKKQKNVLIVSRLYNPEKRLDRAFKIWKHISEKGFDDWTLKIVGTGIHEPFLKELADKLQLKNVIFEGSQSPEKYYEEASIFMMTSSCEGWGLTLTESMQMGVVPVVYDSYPALHDIITDHYDGCIIPDGNLNEYVECMTRLMSNDKERRRIALNGLESCKRFTIDKIIDRWTEILKSL